MYSIYNMKVEVMRKTWENWNIIHEGMNNLRGWKRKNEIQWNNAYSFPRC